MNDVLCQLATSAKFTHDAIFLDADASGYSVRTLLRLFEVPLATWAKTFDKKHIILKSAGKEVRVPASIAKTRGKMMSNNLTSFPGLYLGGEIKIYTSNFLRSLSELLEQKDSSVGLARLRDNAQLCLSQGSAAFMGLADASPLTRLRREDYWNLEDLDSFNREWRQVLREDGSNSIDFKYRALHNPLDPSEGWGLCVTRYSLLVDGSEAYHKALNLEYSQIT